MKKKRMAKSLNGAVPFAGNKAKIRGSLMTIAWGLFHVFWHEIAELGVKKTLTCFLFIDPVIYKGFARHAHANGDTIVACSCETRLPFKPYPSGLSVLQRRFVKGTVSRLMDQIAPSSFPAQSADRGVYRSSFNHRTLLNKDKTDVIRRPFSSRVSIPNRL